MFQNPSDFTMRRRYYLELERVGSQRFRLGDSPEKQPRPEALPLAAK